MWARPPPAQMRNSFTPRPPPPPVVRTIDDGLVVWRNDGSSQRGRALYPDPFAFPTVQDFARYLCAKDYRSDETYVVFDKSKNATTDMTISQLLDRLRVDREAPAFPLFQVAVSDERGRWRLPNGTSAGWTLPELQAFFAKNLAQIPDSHRFQLYTLNGLTVSDVGIATPDEPGPGGRRALPIINFNGHRAPEFLEVIRRLMGAAAPRAQRLWSGF